MLLSGPSSRQHWFPVVPIHGVGLSSSCAEPVIGSVLSSSAHIPTLQDMLSHCMHNGIELSWQVQYPMIVQLTLALEFLRGEGYRGLMAPQDVLVFGVRPVVVRLSCESLLNTRSYNPLLLAAHADVVEMHQTCTDAQLQAHLLVYSFGVIVFQVAASFIDLDPASDKRSLTAILAEKKHALRPPVDQLIDLCCSNDTKLTSPPGDILEIVQSGNFQHLRDTNTVDYENDITCMCVSWANSDEQFLGNSEELQQAKADDASLAYGGKRLPQLWVCAKCEVGFLYSVCVFL